MISRRTPLKRSSPPRKKRPGVRRRELTKAEKEAERDRIYDRCEGKCELRGEDGLPLHRDHWNGVLPKNGSTPWDHWHLVHLHSKRRFGWTEAQGNTLLGGCPACHLEGMHRLGLKPKINR